MLLELTTAIDHLTKRSFPLNDPNSPFAPDTAHSAQQGHYSPMQALTIVFSTHVTFLAFPGHTS